MKEKVCQRKSSNLCWSFNIFFSVFVIETKFGLDTCTPCSKHARLLTSGYQTPRQLPCYILLPDSFISTINRDVTLIHVTLRTWSLILRCFWNFCTRHSTVQSVRKYCDTYLCHYLMRWLVKKGRKRDWKGIERGRGEEKIKIRKEFNKQRVLPNNSLWPHKSHFQVYTSFENS